MKIFFLARWMHEPDCDLDELHKITFFSSYIKTFFMKMKDCFDFPEKFLLFFWKKMKNCLLRNLIRKIPFLEGFWGKATWMIFEWIFLSKLSFCLNTHVYRLKKRGPNFVCLNSKRKKIIKIYKKFKFYLERNLQKK